MYKYICILCKVACYSYRRVQGSIHPFLQAMLLHLVLWFDKKREYSRERESSLVLSLYLYFSLSVKSSQVSVLSFCYYQEKDVHRKSAMSSLYIA